ncbi:TetR/AcrR family transcriptional regulator [Actinoplanes sp. CA-142083]|uniref:TetR/AcrR family transcriptional regulator n=1 Tax=Actinoplanes sp. CA-142083 TaxID=3239903 RepID=UPI003D8E8F75
MTRIMVVGRWEGDAAGRLREAAMRLYGERGYEQTTVADIAAEAGLTARTFFRHYADKREVLFAGSEMLLAHMVEALDAAPASEGPMRAVAAALDAAAVVLSRDPAFSRRRQALIEANAELRERELIKMATIATALSEGLRRRGVPAEDASLGAEAGIAVFKVAWEQWITSPEGLDLGGVMTATLERLTMMTDSAGSGRRSGPRT